VQIFTVTGMTCDHCVRAVTGAIHQLDPAANVQVDLAAGRVSVSGGRIGAPEIARAIDGEGYEARPLAA